MAALNRFSSFAHWLMLAMIVLAVAMPSAAAAQSEGTPSRCRQGGYAQIVPASGDPFSRVDTCARAVAQGTLAVDWSDTAFWTPPSTAGGYYCMFTVTVTGLFPNMAYWVDQGFDEWMGPGGPGHRVESSSRGTMALGWGATTDLIGRAPHLWIFRYDSSDLILESTSPKTIQPLNEKADPWAP